MREPDIIQLNPLPRRLTGLRAKASRSCLALLCVLLFSNASVQGQSGSKEHQLKAAFLFNFTKFVEWNQASFGASDAPIVIGVLGSNAFGSEVERAVQDRKVNGRSLVVRKLRSATESRSVHLLFVSAEEDADVPGIINSLRGAPVLTVGESPAFSRAGGAITFAIEGGKVRFDINTTAAERATVRISSQLQKLARSVIR